MSKIQICLKLGNNQGHFLWTPTHVLLLLASQNPYKSGFFQVKRYQIVMTSEELQILGELTMMLHYTTSPVSLILMQALKG
jgi:hypothetical protein